MRKIARDLKPYLVRQGKAAAKLNQNESPYDVAGSIKRAALEALAAEHWNRYPPHPPDRLKAAIAESAGHPPEGLVVGNSSNEILMATLQTVCRQRAGLVTVSPGFPIHTRIARILGFRISEIPLGEDFAFDLGPLLTAARTADVVLLASPNNPTGTALRPDDIEKLARETKGVFILDEAYHEFQERTALPLLERYGNLILVRTLSKAFGLAGARLGYLLARPEVAAAVENVKLPFSVGIFQQVVGTLVVCEHARRKAIVREILSEKGRVMAGLARIPGVRPIPSLANFILVTIAGRAAAEIGEALGRRGVAVRTFDHPALRHAIRVTVGTPKENTFFLRSLAGIMSGR